MKFLTLGGADKVAESLVLGFAFCSARLCFRIRADLLAASLDK